MQARGKGHGGDRAKLEVPLKCSQPLAAQSHVQELWAEHSPQWGGHEEEEGWRRRWRAGDKGSSRVTPATVYVFERLMPTHCVRTKKKKSHFGTQQNISDVFAYLTTLVGFEWRGLEWLVKMLLGTHNVFIYFLWEGELLRRC